MWDPAQDRIRSLSLVIARPNRRKPGNPVAGWMGHLVFRVLTHEGRDLSVSWGGATGHVPLSNGPASLWRGLGIARPYPACLEILPYQTAEEYFAVKQERELEVWDLTGRVSQEQLQVFGEELGREWRRSRDRELGFYFFLTRNCSTLLLDFVFRTLSRQAGRPAFWHRKAPPLLATRALKATGILAGDQRPVRAGGRAAETACTSSRRLPGSGP